MKKGDDSFLGELAYVMSFIIEEFIPTWRFAGTWGFIKILAAGFMFGWLAILMTIETIITLPFKSMNERVYVAPTFEEMVRDGIFEEK